MRFTDALEAADGVEGWLTAAQARRLYDRAGALEPGARIVEIGSFRGRSAIFLAGGAPSGVEIVCIDPHLGSDRGPQEIAEDLDLGDLDAAAFAQNLSSAGLWDRIRHVRERSQEALEEVAGDVDLLFVDGAHRYGPASDDIVCWGARVPADGRMLVHDSFSSVGVTLALLRHVTFSRRWRYLGRDGSLAEWVRVPAGAVDSARQLAQLPWFARNLVVKALIVARLRPVAKLLGHGDGPWPY